MFEGIFLLKKWCFIKKIMFSTRKERKGLKRKSISRKSVLQDRRDKKGSRPR